MMRNNKDVLLSTDFKDLKLYKRGKVRDVYELGDNLLIVATDRISCFDVVLPCGIPYKGKVLTALASFWFKFIQDLAPHHFLSANINDYPKVLDKYKDQLLFRSMLVKKTKPLPIECVVRGYLAGSAWKEYQETKSICGIGLPPGLLESDKLPCAIFTPSTKQDTGHDINVEADYVEKLLGKDTLDKIKDISLRVYEKASQYALTRGIIIADTKFEFGVDNNEVILIDEVLTPDSSRFWPSSQYSPGGPTPSFDKQFVRDYLEANGWDKAPPAPRLPKGIIEKTTEKYLDAYRMLTGSNLEVI